MCSPVCSPVYPPVYLISILIPNVSIWLSVWLSSLSSLSSLHRSEPSIAGPNASRTCKVVVKRVRRIHFTHKRSRWTAIHAKPQHALLRTRAASQRQACALGPMAPARRCNDDVPAMRRNASNSSATRSKQPLTLHKETFCATQFGVAACSESGVSMS